MKEYRDYAELVQQFNEKLTGMLWGKLSYIKQKSEWLDGYMNYISSKFFPDKDKLSKYDITERINIIESVLQDFDSVKKKSKLIKI